MCNMNLFRYSRRILFALAVIKFTYCGRILALIGTNVKSHLIAFSGFMEHIAPFHNITLYADSTIKYEPSSNIELRGFNVPNPDFYLKGTHTLQTCNVDSHELYRNYLSDMTDIYFEDHLKASDVSHLFSRNETYDIMIVNGYVSYHFFYLAHILDIPLIQMTPSLLLPWHSDAIGNPYSLIDDFIFFSSNDVPSFWERLKKMVKSALLINYFYNVHIITMDTAARKYYPPGMPPWQEINQRTDLIFVNTHSAMGYSRPNIPTVVEVGGIHIRPTKTLSSDLEEFISGAGEHGFIYFGLGTFVSSNVLTEDIQKSILNVLRELPQRVLWKWDQQVPNLPSNVKIAKWLPQLDILGHKNMKLFISHGGMLSTQEAIYHGVPVLIIPIVFDQLTNAFLADTKGFGRSINLCDLNERSFRNNIREIMNNSSYYETTKQMSRTMRYMNRDLQNRINWWINFTIEFRGAKILKPIHSYHLWFSLPYEFLLFFLFALIVIVHIAHYLSMYLFSNIIVIFKTVETKKTN